MRPELLFPLFSDVNRLTGVGPGIKKSLARLLGVSDPLSVPLRDLVFHVPVGLVDRRNSPTLAHAKEGDLVTLVVHVEAHQPPQKNYGKKLPYKIICHTPEGYVTLIYFNARKEQLNSMLPVGQQRVVSGRLERYGAMAQITHPDIVAPIAELEAVRGVEPVYGLTAGVSNRMLRKIMMQALAKVPDLPEWQDKHLLAREGWQGWRQALLTAHAPESADELMPQSKPRVRLAYDELLASQLALSIVRQRSRVRTGVVMSAAVELRSKVMQLLPYALTGGQKRILQEIDADMASGERMLRLLQGDVGSGKTVVALLAMLNAVAAGRQAAFMAPTELLARQHVAFLLKTAQQAGIEVASLMGSLSAAEHAATLERIASGEVAIVVGTHALFQEKVKFHNLGMAVIDEQHRFGVKQRTALIQKSQDAHLLVMTATPIPRTLLMAAYGDLDASQLTEKPAGRQEIATKAIPLSRQEEVLQGIERVLEKGEKVYWVCPLIEGSDEEGEEPDLAAAQARYVEFTHRFRGAAALAHGRMKQQEREQAMLGFAGSRFNLLVATTVVEVGVDVPEATIMVIEHAERFGLTQLHQLRGRVGRNDKPSTCILLYDDNCGETAKARLKIMRETNDGFRIAEEDLKLRGGGDILGTRQSGLPDFRFADMTCHTHLLKMAHDDARLVLQHDPKLAGERGRALRHLLYLFSHDDNIRLLDGG